MAAEAGFRELFHQTAREMVSPTGESSWAVDRQAKAQRNNNKFTLQITKYAICLFDGQQMTKGYFEPGREIEKLTGRLL